MTQAARIEKSLKAADSNSWVCVLHGDNEDLKGDLFRSCCELAGVTSDDPFRFVRLEGEALDLDGGRIADELGSMSMFGGSRLVHVRCSARQSERVVKQALDSPRGQWLLVVECPDLADAEWVSDMAREQRTCIVPCGAENQGDFRTFVLSEFQKASLVPDGPAIARFISLVGDDRTAARAEVLKLSLFVWPSHDVNREAVTEVVADASSALAQDVAQSAFEGNMDDVADALDRMTAAGVNAVAALGEAHRQAIAMVRASARQWGNRGDRIGPTWSAAESRSLLRSLGGAVARTRKDSASASLTAERALVLLSRTARLRKR